MTTIKLKKDLRALSKEELTNLDFSRLSEKLRNDSELMLWLFAFNHDHFQHFPDELRHNKSFIFDCVNLEEMYTPPFEDKEFPGFTRFIPPEVFHDKAFTLQFVRAKPEIFEHLTPDWRDDMDISQAAVIGWRVNLDFLSDRIKADPECMKQLRSARSPRTPFEKEFDADIHMESGYPPEE